MNWPWKCKVKRPKPTPGSETNFILELLEVESLTATMISRRSGTNRNTVAGILRALEDLGYVYRQDVPPSILYHLVSTIYDRSR